MEFIFAFVIAAVGAIIGFTEMQKRERIYTQYLGQRFASDVRFIWEGAVSMKLKPMMRNIIIEGAPNFTALVRVRTRVWRFILCRPYGYVQADENGRLVISMYLGMKQKDIEFYTNTPSATYTFRNNRWNLVNPKEQRYPPDARFLHHCVWYVPDIIIWHVLRLLGKIPKR